MARRISHPGIFGRSDLVLVTGVALVPDVVVWDSSQTQNVTVEINTMNFDATTVGTACTVANLCGFNGVFSNYGTSQYNQTGPNTFRQDNHFSNNTLLERVGPGTPAAPWADQDPSLGPRSGLGPVSRAVRRAPIPDGLRRCPYDLQTIVGAAE